MSARGCAVLALWAGLWLASGARAQEPACAALPEPGRSCVDLILVPPSPTGLGRTGSGGFGSDNEPGNDSNASNHVIRTLDLLSYELRYRVLHQPATAVRIEFLLPAAMDYAEPPNPAFGGAPIPSWCLAGSSLSGQQLRCELGNLPDGSTRNLALLARPRFGTPDGSVQRPAFSISAQNQQSSGPVQRSGYQDALTELDLVCSESRLGASVTLSPCADIVSAAARFDLEFSGYASTNLLDRGARGPQIHQPALAASFPTVIAPAGRRGYTLAFPVAFALPGEGVGGAPASGVGPITLTQRLRNSDGLAGFGELVGCGINGSTDPIPNGLQMPAGWAVGSTQATPLRAVFHPFGTIGLGGSNSSNAAVNSGTIQCSQSAAGGDITLQLTPAPNTFDPGGFPRFQVDGQVSPRQYVLVAMVIVFYPAEPVLLPIQGGTGDGSVTVRHDLGVLQAGALRAFSLGGIEEPDGAAINDGFGAVGQYDDDNNNFSIATLDAGAGRYQKTWRNPRRDTLAQGYEYCLKDASDPVCRHGYAFPGSNLAAEFVYSNLGFDEYSNAQFCDEWDATRTQLRKTFDPLAQSIELPADGALFLDLGGANATPAGLNSAGYTVEVSSDPGSVPNIDWQPTEPARSDARSQLSAPECSSGNWVAASLPPVLQSGRQRIDLPPALESPPGSGRYPSIRRVRLRANQLAPFITVGLVGSYEVLSQTPGTRLPNRTAFRFGNESLWRYAENDHAIVRSADTSISMTASANVTTGQTGPLTSIGYGEVFETTLSTRFTSGDGAPPAVSTPLIVKSYLPATLDYVAGSATPALHVPPYAGSNPETGQPAQVLEWRFANPVPGLSVPDIRYLAQLALGAANNVNVHSSATVEHALDPSPLFEPGALGSAEDRLAFQDLRAVVPVGLLLSKVSTTPFIDANGTQSYTLRYANSAGAPFAALRLIDVLPYNGDAVNTANAYSGSLAGGSLGPTAPEYALYYSTTAPAAINRNPNCVSNGGSLPDGSGACPAAGASWMASSSGSLPAGVTAVRVDDGNGIAANSVQSLTLTLQTAGNLPGDVYENSLSAVAPGESLVLASAKAQVRVPAGELRAYVYADLDSSASPTPADQGIGGVTLTLTGTDRQGRAIEVVTRTVDTFSATSTVIDLRINGGPVQSLTCPSALRMRLGEAYLCRLPSANAAGYTLRETQPAGYQDRNETLGQLQSGGFPGVLGNDVFTGIALTNDLSTGAGDLGTQYAYGEAPLYAPVSGRVYQENSNPLNTLDDDEPEDPGIVTEISLQCAPAYSASLPSGQDGNYYFAQVPVDSDCVITETQPAGYLNAYNTRGGGATGDTGGAGSGSVASTISLRVPLAGSGGNNFAEYRNTDTVSSISCVNPAPLAGEAMVCEATCSNLGPSVALTMGCQILDAQALPNAQLIGCTTVNRVTVGGTVSCLLLFDMPPGTLTLNAGSSALNDVNGGNDPRAGNNPSRISLGSPLREVPISPWSSALLLLLLGGLAARRAGPR